MIGAEFQFGEAVSLFGHRLACSIIAFIKQSDHNPVQCIDDFLRLRFLSGLLLQKGRGSLDIIFYFLLLGMSNNAQAQQPPLLPNNRSVSLCVLPSEGRYQMERPPA